MATYRAIATACQAIARMLEEAYRSEEFKGNAIAFTVCDAEAMAARPASTVTLFVYRVAVDASTRGRSRAEKGRQAPPLPVEVHFIVTAWGRDASQEQRILGWTMRVLNDSAVLGPAVLNAGGSDVFEADEAVEVAPGDLEPDAMARLWASLGLGPYRLSLPYVARGIRLG